MKFLSCGVLQRFRGKDAPPVNGRYQSRLRGSRLPEAGSFMGFALKSHLGCR